MHFDDRLDTVLRLPPAGDGIARIQYRQLLDLLGTIPPSPSQENLDRAVLRLGELSRVIPAEERAAIMGEPGLRLRSPMLVSHLISSEPVVALAAIDKAMLDDEQWLDLIPALPLRARRVLRYRRDLGARVEIVLDRLGVSSPALPSMRCAADARSPEPPTMAAPVPERQPVSAPANAAEEPIAEIGAIVRRIEAFRRTRESAFPVANGGDVPRLPLDDTGHELPLSSVDAFDFTTDVEGRITWADAAIAPMVTGFNLPALASAPTATLVENLAAGFRYRQPLRRVALILTGAPAISGRWIMDAVPRFERPGGGFAGYCGRMRRSSGEPIPAAAPSGQGDRMRQMLHELRTPVNAVQGFAEVLLYQLYGPTPQEYRALAAAIAGDAARILAGFDELDRLVRLDSGALRLERGEVDLGGLLESMLARLRPVLEPRSSGFVPALEGDLSATMAHDDAERLLWRLLATLASASAPGEVLRLRGRRRDDMVRLTLRLPATLAARSDEELLRGSVPSAGQALSAGMFGIGFALRLAAAEARGAGGSLERRGDRLRLSLPALTGDAAPHSGLPEDADGGGSP